MRSRSKLCINCHNKQIAAVAIRRIVHRKGYILHRIGSKYKFEHIIVMEQLLGRSLLKGEHIHHINGIKTDNCPENLELWIRSHPTGIRAKDALQWARQLITTYSPIEYKLVDPAGSLTPRPKRNTTQSHPHVCSV